MRLPQAMSSTDAHCESGSALGTGVAADKHERRPRRRGQDGAALVLALWLLSLLTILAVGYGYATRTETRLASHALELARSRAVAEAGVWLALADLLKPEAERQWLQDGTPYSLDFGDGHIRLRIHNEAGKVDLNTAHDELLRALLEQAAQPGDDVDLMLNAILDWRDPDSVRRNPGAEDRDYEHAGYGAQDAPFNSIEQLRLVAGMSNEVFARIYPALTLYSGQPTLYLPAATRATLLALPGADEEAVDAFLLARGDGNETPNPPPGINPGFFGGARGNVFHISSTGGIGNSRLQLDVVLALNNDPRAPYSILSWQEAKPVYGNSQG